VYYANLHHMVPVEQADFAIDGSDDDDSRVSTPDITAKRGCIS